MLSIRFMALAGKFLGEGHACMPVSRLSEKPPRSTATDALKELGL